jgi:hypothetical protein
MPPAGIANRPGLAPLASGRARQSCRAGRISQRRKLRDNNHAVKGQAAFARMKQHVAGLRRLLQVGAERAHDDSGNARRVKYVILHYEMWMPETVLHQIRCKPVEASTDHRRFLRRFVSDIRSIVCAAHAGADGPRREDTLHGSIRPEPNRRGGTRHRRGGPPCTAPSALARLNPQGQESRSPDWTPAP